MKSNIVERSTADVLGEALREGENPLVIAPDAPTIEALVEVLDDGWTPIRLLADPDALKTAMGDFLLAGRAADHSEAGRLEIRTDTEETNTLLLTGTSVVAVVRAGDHTAGLTTDDEAFTKSATERFESAWERADVYTLRTPSMTRVRETLKTELGESTAEDFDTVLSSLEATETDHGFDEVTIALLVAAKNEELLYDISKWGEDVGIASKATFSRTKTRMEEAGILDTEKVPIDVGRPRLRLKFADERLKTADADQLVDVARPMLKE